MISERVFGAFPNGKLLRIWTIRNCYGESVDLLEYGASINALNVMDRERKVESVVYGAQSAEQLCLPGARRAAIMGRCGNRIKSGKCVLDGREVQLETNEKGNLIHSGSANYADKFFKGEKASENSVSFTYLDPGGAGFDSEVDVRIIYTFDDEHGLAISYELIPHGTTVLSPTNHAYFHLDSSGTVLDHKLMIRAEKMAFKDETGCPTGEVFEVKGTPFDLANSYRIGDKVEELKRYRPSSPFYDDYYLVERCGEMKEVAELYSSVSGRKMKVETDMPCVILFSRGRKIDGAFTEADAVCLETQFVPNAVNCPQFDSPVFHKGEVFRSKTVYRFSTDMIS
ncbi:MAG: galactose mutarotase [Oscillospiraceae bacterium]|nr:galactose mutarotase [Oscillospiraceae bacterium]